MLYLNVPFTEKDLAKQYGARWDPLKKRWYLPDPEKVDLSLFSAWLDASDQTFSVEITNKTTQAESDTQALALSQLLQQVQRQLQQKFAQALWVHAEIASLNERRGHVYLELSENNPQGQALASCRAMIWASQAAEILAEFKQVTGTPLQEGQKILMQVQVNFHEKFGFSLQVQAINPQFTLGEIEANLNKIREQLIKEKLFHLNKGLTLAKDLFHVAVIAPPNAAGLGDFRAEADQLECHKLCRFTYFYSAFQGQKVADEFISALQACKDLHESQSFDALVIIRGGGAKLDLNPLNQIDIARALAQMPMPVLTGIGHERDNTVLDEMAHTRFDTPSKVIEGIWHLIKHAAYQAQQAWQNIDKQSRQHLVQQQHGLQQLQQQIYYHQQQAFNFWQQKLKPLQDTIQYQTRLLLKQESMQIQQNMAHIERQIQHRLQSSYQAIETYRAQSEQWALKQLQNQRQAARQTIAFILSSGPNSQLKRGFTLAKTENNQPITSAQQARQQTGFILEFHDGEVKVKVE